MTGPRVFSRMADDGVFPAMFRTGPDSISRTVLLQTFIAASLVMVSNLSELLGYLSTTLALSSAVAVFTLLLPSKRSATDVVRPMSFVVKICAFAYVASTFVIAGLMANNEPDDLKATGVTLLLGGVLWMFSRGRFLTEQSN